MASVPHPNPSKVVRSSVAATVTRESLRDAVNVLCRADPELSAVVSQFGHPPTWFRKPGFATLIRIILEQQVSLTSARRAYERLQTKVTRVSPRSVRQLGFDGLRSAGLTRQKSRYCINLAEQVADGRIVLRRLIREDPAQIRETLTAVTGIGNWTVDIFLIMAVRHADTWPSGDLALAKAMQEVKDLKTLPDQDTQLTLAASWSPFRAVAARILWHHYLSVRRQKVDSN